MSIKKLGRELICRVLEYQVRTLRRRHQFTIVAVAGSVGKTSSKLAIAKLLASEKRVLYQEGNYNDRVTVPLVVFGQDKPTSLFDVWAWLRIFAANQRAIEQPYPYDIVVLELGTDAPGQIREFSYLRPDLSVVTAVSPEHMENFSTLDAVAREELRVAKFSKRLLVNADDVDEKYRRALPPHETYGLNSADSYHAAHKINHALRGSEVTVYNPDGRKQTFHSQYLGAHGVKTVLCALAAADMLGLPVDQLKKQAEQLQPFAGRMRILAGKHGSIIIDDTYNASPLAVKAALEVLYMADAGERIAILGSMNELGKTSRSGHEEIATYCDPAKLSAVVTIGYDANTYLAPIAKKKGCEVQCFASPYDAGAWVAERLRPGTVVLAKGSQNGVFAEEALKFLLANSADEAELVRQSRYWMRVKQKQFGADRVSA